MTSNQFSTDSHKSLQALFQKNICIVQVRHLLGTPFHKPITIILFSFNLRIRLNVKLLKY